jgi:hypothetical protein
MILLLQTTTAPSPAPTASTPDDRSTTFQPVTGGEEQHSGTTLLVEAYVVLWVILMAWIFLMWRKQAAISARVEGLERAIDRAAAKQDKKST